MSEEPPIVTSVNYEITAQGVYLTVNATTGTPTTVFLPNRMLRALGRMLSARATTLEAEREARKQGEDEPA